MGLIISAIFIVLAFLLLRGFMNKQAPYNDPTKVDATWPFPEAEKPIPFPTGKKP